MAMYLRDTYIVKATLGLDLDSLVKILNWTNIIAGGDRWTIVVC